MLIGRCLALEPHLVFEMGSKLSMFCGQETATAEISFGQVQKKFTKSEQVAFPAPFESFFRAGNIDGIEPGPEKYPIYSRGKAILFLTRYSSFF